MWLRATLEGSQPAPYLPKDPAMTEDPSATGAAGRSAVQPPSVPRRLPGGPDLAVTAGAHRTLVQVAGEIDMDSADGMRETLEQLLHQSGTGLDLDTSAVTFCDSYGLNMLLRLRLTALRAKRRLTITDPGPRLERLLALTETTALFTLDGHPDGATPPGGTRPADAKTGLHTKPVHTTGLLNDTPAETPSPILEGKHLP